MLQHITDYATYELKTTEFEPSDTGQISFYLSAVDDLLRHPDNKNSIGMVLCKRKDKIVVEYALRDNLKPIGVASYEAEITNSLPENIQSSLPTIEELEANFAREETILSS